jgi:hypothetical protein
VRNIEVMGEAVKRLSEDVHQAHPDIPWRAMAGMRDKVIHHYFGVNYDVVWKVAAEDVRPASLPEGDSRTGKRLGRTGLNPANNTPVRAKAVITKEVEQAGCQVRRILLFGSRARGEGRLDSDRDFFEASFHEPGPLQSPGR